jgi:hypothetical protein
MKLIRDGDQKLQLVTGNYLLPGWFILLGGGGFAHELYEFISGKQHLTDFKSAIPLLATALFLFVGLALFRRYSCCFDLLNQRATWKSRGLFGFKTRVVPFSQIKWIDFEIDPNNFANDHPQWGPPRRLVLATTEGPLPFSDMYQACGKKEDEIQQAINTFLNRHPEATSPDDRIRDLVARGEIIQAVHILRRQRGCSLAEAKDLVERMR